MEFFASIALGFTAFVNSVLGLPGEIVQSFKTDLTPPVQERTVDAQNDLAKIIETSAVPDGADPNTYVVLYEGEDGMYAKDKDSVYYSSELLGWVPKKVNGADPHTFTILYTPEGKLTHYGKDKDRTYLRIFEVYESGAEHGTDISFVSNNEQASAPISSSPQITTGPRESNASISFSPAVRPKAFGTPSNTDGQFITIHEDTLGAYGKDASRVYHISAKTAWIWREVEGADPTTFSVILTPQNTISLYAKDKRAVYYDAVEVSGADPNTFYVISGAATVDGYDYYAKDRKSVYSFAFPVDNADPLTFEPITFKNAGISTYSLFGKDSDGIFCDYDELWADYATFQVLDYNSAIDATHAFEYCTQRTERFPKTISFDSLVQEKQALGVGIGLKFDPNTQDTSANAVATELTHVLDYMKKGADLFYVQYKTYTGYCDNAAMESGMKTLLKRFEGWIGVRSISCISDAQGFMAAVEVPVAGLFCVDTKGYADVIRDFSLYGHTQSSCPAWQTPQLSSDDEDRLTAINLLSLQKEMYEYYQSHDSYKGACESTTIAARIKEMPAYGTWGVYCYADEDRFLAETRLSDTNFACVDSKGNAHRIHGTSQYENQCDLEGETEFLKRVQAGEIEVCVNGVCVPVQDYEYEGIYNDTWDEI